MASVPQAALWRTKEDLVLLQVRKEACGASRLRGAHLQDALSSRSTKMRACTYARFHQPENGAYLLPTAP